MQSSVRSPKRWRYWRRRCGQCAPRGGDRSHLSRSSRGSHGCGVRRAEIGVAGDFRRAEPGASRTARRPNLSVPGAKPVVGARHAPGCDVRHAERVSRIRPYDLGISRMLFRTSCICSVCRPLGVVFDAPTGPHNSRVGRGRKVSPTGILGRADRTARGDRRCGNFRGCRAADPDGDISGKRYPVSCQPCSVQLPGLRRGVVPR